MSTLVFLTSVSIWPSPTRKAWGVLPVLTVACYWPLKLFFSGQKFVSVSAELHHNRPPYMLDCNKHVWFHHISSLLYELDGQSQPRHEGVVGSCHINTFLFAYNLMQLVSSGHGFQHTLDQFSAACDRAEIKTSTANTEAFMFIQKPKPVRAANKRLCMTADRCVRVLWNDIHEWQEAKRGGWHSD